MKFCLFCIMLILPPLLWAEPCVLVKPTQCPQNLNIDGTLFAFRGANWSNGVTQCIYYTGYRQNYTLRYCEVAPTIRPTNGWRSISVNLNIWVCGFLQETTLAKECPFKLYKPSPH